MKKIIYSFILFTIPLFAIAQNVPNPGMELWTNQGSYEDPNGYFTSNFYVTLGAPTNVTKTTDRHGGNFAAKLTSFVVAFGPSFDTIPANMTIGDPMAGIDGSPFTTRPANMHIWYKYSTAQDTGAAIAILSKWNASTGNRDIVATAAFEFTGATGSYMQQSSPLFYFTGANPDTISMLIFSSLAEIVIPGSSLYIDDISFSGNVGLEENVTQEIKVYPNPAIDRLNIDLPKAGIYSFEIIDMSAKKVRNVSLIGKNDIIDLKGIPQGLYIYRILNTEKQVISSGKFNVIRD